MNKIFKVLWNRSRSTNVVTDETRTAHGKGRQGVTVVCAASPSRFAVGLAAALAAMGLGLSSPLWAASTITPGWNHTQVYSNNGVHTIRTDAVNGTVGINKFEKFDLVAKEIANLQFGKASHLLNFVNDKITVNGTVNAIKDGSVGGNLYFISSQGMMVGSTGVINAGSLTVAVPKADDFTVWYENLQENDYDRYDEAFAQNLRTGAYPINADPKNLITVAGSINAGNEVALMAGTIKVEEGARIQTGVTKFSDLVNVRENGAVITSAGLEGNLEFVSAADDTGDVILLARADASHGETDASKFFEGYVGGLEEIDASVTVAEGAEITSKGDVSITALAGNDTYNTTVDPETNAFIGFETSDKAQSSSVSAKVEVNGKVTAAGDLTVKAETYNLLEHKNTFNLGALSENLQTMYLGALGASTVEWADVDASADVAIGERATLSGRDVTIGADSTLNLNIGDSTGWASLGTLTPIDGYIPVVGLAVALSDASSSITVAGNVTAKHELDIHADTDFTSIVATKAVVKDVNTPQLAFTYADFSSNADVTVESTAKLDAEDGASVRADVVNRVETAAEVMTYNTGKGGIGVSGNVTFFDSDANLQMKMGFVDEVGGKVDIGTTNNTQTFDVLSKTTVGDLGILMKVQAAATNKIGDILPKIGANMADASNGAASVFDGLQFEAGGAFAYVENHQNSDVSLEGANPSIIASNDLTVESEARLSDYHYEVSTKQVIAETDTSKGQGAVAVLVAGDGEDTVHSSVSVGDGFTLTSGNDLTISSETEINKDRWEFLTEEIKRSFEELKALFQAGHYDTTEGEIEALRKRVVDAFDAIGKGENLSENFDLFTGAVNELTDLISKAVGTGTGAVSDIAGQIATLGFDIFDLLNPASYTNAYVSAGSVTNDAQNAPISVAGSVGVLRQVAKSDVSIGANAKLSARKGLEISSSTDAESVAMGGYLDNFLGVPLPNRDNAKAIGATVLYNEMTSGSSVTVEEGAAVTAGEGGEGDLTIESKDAIDAVTITATAGYNKGGLTVSGLAAVSKTNGRNAIAVDDEAKLSGDNVKLTATRDDSVQTIGAGVSATTNDGGSGSVGAGVAVNLGELANSLSVSDLESGEADVDYGAGGITAEAAGGTIDIAADSTLNVNAIGIAGQGAVASTGDKEPDATSFLDENAAGAVTEDVTDIVAEIRAAMAQNSSGDNWLAEGADLPDDPAASAGTPDISTAAGKEDAGKVTLNLAGAGSFAWNDLDASNLVTISSEALDGPSYALDAEGVSVEAVTDKWFGSIAGAAGVAAVTGSSGAKVNASIGGAAAVNDGVFANTVSLKGVSTTADTMNVASLVNGTTLAEGLGMSVAAGQSQVALGIDAGVSVNLVENTVGATVEGLKNFDDGDDRAFVYEQAAWSGETQVTGGTSVGVAAGGQSASAAIGGSVAVANITNDITSTLKDSTLKNAQTVNVSALASLTQVNTAVGAQVAQGKGTTAAVSGAVISAQIKNNVTADVSHSSIKMADVDNASVSIEAGTAGTGEGEAAHAYAERAQGVEGVFTREKLLNTNLTTGIKLKKDNEENGASMNVQSDILDGADMTQVSVALGVGVAAGGTDNGTGSAGVLVTNFANKFVSSTDGLEVRKAGKDAKDFRYEQTAASGVNTVNVAAGVAAAAGGNFNLSAAGSVVVSGVTQQADATAKDLVLDAAAAGEDGALNSVVAAENHAHTVNVAGNASVGIGSAGAGVGAAVVVSNLVNTARAGLEGATLSGDRAQSVAVSAKNEAESWSAAVNGTVATNASISGSVVKNAVANNAIASAHDVTLDGLDALVVNASDKSDLWTLSGSVAVSYKLESAAAGGAVSYAYAEGETKAEGENITVPDAQGKPDVSVSADAADEIHTLTLGLSVAPAAGIGGSVGINTVDRTVTAALKNLGAEFTSAQEQPSAAFGAVGVTAKSREKVENLGVVIAGAAGASIGAGVAVNTIGTDVDASVESSVFTAESLRLEAKSAGDIETVGVGAAVGGTTVGGSTAVSRIEGNTNAALKDAVLTVDDAAAVTAQSDDVIGTYGGQVTYGGTAGAGLSVSVAERTGTTAALLKNARVEETGASQSAAGLAVRGGVADEHINDKIVEDVSIGASLEDHRADETVEGVRVAATSTATYKTVLANAAASGITSMQGVGSTVTHAGKTTTDVRNSTLTSASGVDVLAGDYANFDTVATAGGVSAANAAGVAYAGVTTKHETAANVSGSTLSAPDVNLAAEAKEGVSALGVIGELAMQLGASALANTVHQGSSVATLLENSTVTGARYAQHADYLGRITDLGVAATGSLAAAGAVSVFLNTAANDVSSTVSAGSKVLSTESIAIEADRTSEWNQTTVTAGLGAKGAATAFVAVNTIEGETTLTTDGSTLGTDETDTLVLGASNIDDIDLTTVSANASLGYSLGASVLVNQLNGAASLSAKNSTLTGTSITATAEQNRFVDAESVYGSAALTGGLSANIVSTVVGSATNDFAALFGGDETGLSDTGHAVEGYVSAYGGTETIESFLKEHGDSLSEEEQKEILANAAHNASERLQTGTHATFVDTAATGETIDVAAREDAMEGAGVDVTVGSGTGSVGVALAASVATLTRHHNVEASITGGSLSAKNISFGASADADDKVEVIQVAGGLATGQAAWVEATNDGAIHTLVAGDATFQTTAEKGDILVYAENTGSTDLFAQGVGVGGVTAGGMIARLTDASLVEMKMENALFAGDSLLKVDRAQTLQAHAMAGYGGAVSGMGAEATVTDKGNAQATLTNVTSENRTWETIEKVEEKQKIETEDGKTEIVTVTVEKPVTRTAERVFSVDVNLHPTIKAIADSAGGGALTVGVVQATAEASGEAGLEVSGGRFETAEVSFAAGAGRKTDDEADALGLAATISSYGGAVVGINANKASVTNDTKTNVSVTKAAFGADTALAADALSHAEYDVVASAASGGVIRSDNNEVAVNHNADVTMTLEEGGALGSLDAAAQNSAAARLSASSAGGSVIDVGAKAVSVGYADAANATITMKGNWTTAGDLSATAETLREIDFLGRNTTGTVAGGNGAFLSNAMKGKTEVVAAEDASLSAGADLTLSALQTIDVGAADDETYALESGVYGAIAGAGIGLTNTQETIARVTVGKGARLRSNDVMTLAAKTVNHTDLAVKLRTAGAFNVVRGEADHVISTTNEVIVGEGANLRTTSPEGTMTLSASAEETIALQTAGTVEGAAVGGAAAFLDFNYDRANRVTIGQNASLRSGENLELFAGRDAAGKDAFFDNLLYTMATSHSGVAPVNSDIENDYDTENLVTVARGADVVSTADMDVAATNGEFSTRVEARYYNWTSASDAGDVELATTANGKVSQALTQKNLVTVEGDLLAGVNTRVDVTIEGMVFDEESAGGNEEGKAGEPLFDYVTEPDITVSASDELSESEIAANISLDEEHNANPYWERHQELQTLIQELASLDKDKEGDATVLTAYRAEDEALVALMLDEGYAERDDQGELRAVDTVARPYVSVSGITVSGGNIHFTTDRVEGGGSVTAQAAEGIFVSNGSNLALDVSDLAILSQGGNVTMNEVGVQTGDAREDFAVGKLSTATATTNPTISIESTFNGSLEYAHESGTQTITQTVTPDTSVVVSGNLTNRAGDIVISSASDIVQKAETLVSAAGGVSLDATGNVLQFYTSGLRNVGMEVEKQWADKTGVLDDSAQWGGQTSWESGPDDVRDGNVDEEGNTYGIVAGDDVLISGQMINVNGTIQSGYASYALTLEKGADLDAAVQAVRERWQQKGSKENINVKSRDFLVSEGGYFRTEDGSYAYRVAAWYDPVNDRIVLDDIVPEGGHVYLTGTVANTGGGRIYAAEGSADVRVDVDYDLLTGTIDTGNREGLIRIADTGFAEGDRTAKVTEYRSEGGVTTGETWWIDAQGKESERQKVDIAHGYDPKENLAYTWSWGYQVGEKHVKYNAKAFQWWGLAEWDAIIGSAGDAQVEPLPEGSPLTPGHTLTTSGQTSAAQGSITETDRKEGAWQWTTWTTYDDALHWSGMHHAEGTQYVTSTRVATFTVKADHNIETRFLGGENTIDIASGGSLHLGGALTATNGTVSLAAKGDILNASSSAAVRGASNVTLAAGGSIGTATSAIRLTGGAGEMKVSAEAGGSLHLDATLATAERLTGSLTAGDDVTVATTNDLALSRLVGTDVSLRSTEGDIVVKDFTQNAALDGTERFDASAAAGSIDVRVSEGDLGLGEVVASGDVTLTIEKGNLKDALPREAESALTVEERLEAWKAAGLIGDSGENIGSATWESDVAKAEAGVRNDFALYEAYLAAGEEALKSDEDKTLFAQLQSRFAGYANADAAVAGEKADASTALGKIAAAQDNYGWTQNDLLYAVAEAIANPDSSYVPTAGTPNIRGERIVLNASGSIGLNADAVTGKVDSTTAEGLDMLKYLAQADVDDVTWHEDGSVTVSLKHAVTVEGNALAADAGENLYVQSNDDSSLRVERAVAAEGAVRLTSRQGIVGLADAVSGEVGFVSGSTVTLRGGDGGVGAADASMHVHHGEDGWLALSSEGDIYVDADDESLTIYSVSGGGDVHLKASDLYAYTGDAVDFEDKSIRFENLGYLSAGEDGVFYLDVTGDLGREDAALRFDSDAKLSFADTAQNVWIETVGGEGTLEINGIRASGVVDVRATAGLAVGEATGSTVSLSSVLDLTATHGTFAATAGDLSFASSEGSVDLTGSVLRTPGVLHVEAQENLRLVDVVFDAAGGLDLSAGEGDLDLSGSSGLKSDYVDLEAGGELSLVGTEVVVNDHFSATAGEDLHAAGIDLTVGEPGDVTFRSGTGDVDLTDASFAGTTGSLGAVVVEAAADARLDGLFAAGKDFTAKKLAVSAGETLSLGDEALKVAVTEGDLVLKATTLQDEGFGDGSVFRAKGDVEMTFASDLHAGEGFALKGENVVLEANGFSAGDGSTLRADSSVTIAAQGNVALTGDVLVTGNEAVSVSAETGGIRLDGAVTIGDETLDEASADVTLTAKGDIVQTVTSGDGGVRADALTATSDAGSVRLGAGRDETVGSEGNAFSSAKVESAGDVILGTSGRETKVSINESRDGAVEGDLKLYGDENGLLLSNDLRVAGDALIEAAAVQGGALEAEGALEVVAAFFDDSAAPGDLSGIRFAGPLTGTHVSLITDNGDIDVGRVTSTEGFVDAYRLGTASKGEVTIGGGSSAHTATFYNGNGDICVTDVFTAQNTAYALTGSGGTTQGVGNLVSTIHKAAAVDGAESLTDAILEGLREGAAAEGLTPGRLPHLDFSAPALETADVDRLSPFVFFGIDTISPSDAFFFLHLRPDAESARRGPDEEGGETELEEGLPGRAGGVIRDLREPVEAVPPGWILGWNE